MQATTTRQYTIAELRDELPAVTAKVGNRLFIGRISGRNCQFPIVSTTGPDVAAEFSWKAIQHAKNTGSALLLG